MPLTMVSAVPFIFGTEFCATSVEKRGESATTSIPQNSKNAINTYEPVLKKNGENIQHKQESDNAANAVFFVPIR